MACRNDSAGADLRALIDRAIPWAVHDDMFSHQTFGTGPSLPQGWKLHVSATAASAMAVFSACLDVLLAEGARFKLVHTLDHLVTANAGDLGLSQIGKFLTVYPSSDEQAVALAVALDEATSGLRGPRVPSDRPLRPGSLVHYRYGSMHDHLDLAATGRGSGDGYAMRDAAGRMIDDVRLHYYVPPDGVADPFEAAGVYRPRPPRPPVINERYLIFNALARSARGGVFLGVDLGVTPVRPCLIKEAWHDVGADAHGRDARDWLANEEAILRRHQDSPHVPAVIDSFVLNDDRYLVLDYIHGETLEQHFAEKGLHKGGLPTAVLMSIARATANALADLHQRGVVFRDFSPSNVIVTPEGGYRLIDFGIAYDLRVGSEAPLGGGTPSFVSPQQFESLSPTPSDDMFAWGAVLHYLASGVAAHPPDRSKPSDLKPVPRPSIAVGRPNLPPPFAETIDRALSWSSADRFANMKDALAQLGDSNSAHLAERPAAAVRSDPAAPEDDVPVDSALALKLALDVGGALCRSAEERDGGLCWGSRNEHVGSLSYLPDLYSGAAGVALFLAELSQASGATKYAEAARGAARWLAGPRWGNGRAQHGFQGGEAGVAYFFLRLADLLGEPGYIVAADLRMRRLQGAASQTIDLIHGSSGTMLVLTALHQATQEAHWREWACAIGDDLIGQAQHKPGSNGLFWEIAPSIPGASAERLLGLLHGNAGVGLSLAHLGHATGDQRYIDAAKQAGNLLLEESQACPEAAVGGHAALRWKRRTGDTDAGLQATCHGAGGIALFLRYLARLTHDQIYLLGANGATATMSALRRSETRSGMCHGLSGIGHLLLDAYQATGDDQRLIEARDCASRLLRFQMPDQAGVYALSRGAPPSPDLMLGYAGIGSLFLRLADPRLRREPTLGTLLHSSLPH